MWQAFLDDPNGSYTKPLRQVNASQNYHISPATLEARIKEELISLGLLEPQEVSQHAILTNTFPPPQVPLPFQQTKEGSDEDEILTELKKAQSELKTVVSTLP